MSHRRTTHTSRQRSFVVSIDPGTFANIEIIIEGGNHHHRGAWPPPRATTATRDGPENHQGYSYGYRYGASPISYAHRLRVTNNETGSPVPLLNPRGIIRLFCIRIDHGTTMIAPTSPTKRSPFVPLQSQQPPTSVGKSTSSSADARGKLAYEWERLAARRRIAEERAREQQRRREEARLAEARRAAAEEARRRHVQQQRQALRDERRRQERTRRAREIASAWRTYEKRWVLLSQRQPEPGLLSALTFERIPWPVADAPRNRTLDALRPEAIREFLLSPAHSPDVSPKDRIRAGLRRWHPDKFARVLSQVMESDRDAVADGMGTVVRCLNDMLEKENQAQERRD